MRRAVLVFVLVAAASASRADAQIGDGLLGPDEPRNDPPAEEPPANDTGGNATEPPSDANATSDRGPSFPSATERPNATSNATAGDGALPGPEPAGADDPPPDAASDPAPPTAPAADPEPATEDPFATSDPVVAPALPPPEEALETVSLVPAERQYRVEVVEAPSDPGPGGLLLVGGGVAAVAFAARTRTRRLWPLLGAFFTRISSDGALRHPLRQEIHARVGARPGIRYRELASEMGLAHGVLTHHLRMLEKTDLVVARREAGVARFYHPGAAPRGPVFDPPTAALLDLVRAAGRVRPSEAAARLGCDRRDVARRAEKLLALGAVLRETHGRAVYLVPRVTPRSDVGMTIKAPVAPGTSCGPGPSSSP